MIAVDARQWRYVLYEFKDDTFDVVVEQSHFPSES